MESVKAGVLRYMTSPDCRKVLECASPLALWRDVVMQKRWRTTAVQNAAALVQALPASLGNWTSKETSKAD
jgi:hypothetical protein